MCRLLPDRVCSVKLSLSFMERAMNGHDFAAQLRGARLTTAEVLYYPPRLSVPAAELLLADTGHRAGFPASQGIP